MMERPMERPTALEYQHIEALEKLKVGLMDDLRLLRKEMAKLTSQVLEIQNQAQSLMGTFVGGTASLNPAIASPPQADGNSRKQDGESLPTCRSPVRRVSEGETEHPGKSYADLSYPPFGTLFLPLPDPLEDAPNQAPVQTQEILQGTVQPAGEAEPTLNPQNTRKIGDTGTGTSISTASAKDTGSGSSHQGPPLCLIQNDNNDGDTGTPVRGEQEGVVAAAGESKQNNIQNQAVGTPLPTRQNQPNSDTNKQTSDECSCTDQFEPIPICMDQATLGPGGADENKPTDQGFEPIPICMEQETLGPGGADENKHTDEAEHSKDSYEPVAFHRIYPQKETDTSIDQGGSSAAAIVSPSDPLKTMRPFTVLDDALDESSRGRTSPPETTTAKTATGCNPDKSKEKAKTCTPNVFDKEENGGKKALGEGERSENPQKTADVSTPTKVSAVSTPKTQVATPKTRIRLRMPEKATACEEGGADKADRSTERIRDIVPNGTTENESRADATPAHPNNRKTTTEVEQQPSKKKPSPASKQEMQRKEAMKNLLHRQEAELRQLQEQHQRAIAVLVHHANGESTETEREKEMRRQKERFLMFTRVLMKYLETKDRTLHGKVKKVIKECAERNKRQEPGYESVTASMRERFKEIVPDDYWKRAESYLDHFLAQKQKRDNQTGGSSSSPSARPVTNEQRPPVRAAVAHRTPNGSKQLTAVRQVYLGKRRLNTPDRQDGKKKAKVSRSPIASKKKLPGRASRKGRPNTPNRHNGEKKANVWTPS
ncbi:expressed unknown protein [Seminavis robusta]|uniref:Uncharacterized protein n=1 Tax=Seminavis robusta TaxID=568900 RepID=A0A9N8DYC2_9STRA|nr:expressed unknown protein [Seminavis robusta]|eukprot:Sro339_g121100.1 n/a (771) ;mRNA; f:61414-63726